MKQKNNRDSQYLKGFLSFIPLVGVFIGIVLILKNLSCISKRKRLIVIVILGIIFNISIYSSIYYESKYGNLFDEGYEMITKLQLNRITNLLDSYKTKYKQYPDSLSELLKLNPQPKLLINDVFYEEKKSKEVPYFYKKTSDSTYLLFSSGADMIINTQDDIYPENNK